MKRKYVWVVVNDETGKPLLDMGGLLTVCGTKLDARSYAHYYSNVGMGKFRVRKYVAEGEGVRSIGRCRRGRGTLN